MITPTTSSRRSGLSASHHETETGAGGAFSVGAIARTEMAGPEPAMRAETAYLALLGQATSCAREDGTLTLFDEGGNESLIFSAA